MTNTAQVAAPEFFKSVTIPAVAKWAADKVKEHTPYVIQCEGRNVSVHSWFFEGKFPRRADEFYNQWDAPKIGKQFTCTVRCLGGHYRGQKPTVIVGFTEYTSEDGQPLPR
jgi:hypothetical protein